MLLELAVEQFALIDRLRLALHPGLNVLTGETGAGKSIVLDALALVLGGRGAADLVRTGATRATVGAAFDLAERSGRVAALAEMGVELAEDNLLVIRRELAAGARSRITINGTLTSLGMLRDVAGPLVDLHGQHEFQTLLHPERHLDLLDQYGGSLLRAQGKPLEMLDRYGGETLGALRHQVAALWQDLRAVATDLAALAGDARDRARREDLLRFQLRELAAAALRPGEEEELFAERQVLGSAERLQTAAQEAYARLYSGGARQPSVLDTLGQCLTSLGDLSRQDPALQPLLDLLQTALANVEEAAHFLARYRDQIEISPQRLQQVEERLQLLNALRRKYGESVTDMLAYAENIRTELERLASAEETIAQLRARQSELGRQAEALAAKLSAERQAAAQQLGAAVTREIRDLGMPAAEFQVALSTPASPSWQDVTSAGWDSVTFLFQSGAGEPAKPLVRIASGGELSRIMLALKAILARVDGVATLVFDEIDTGIGGRTAQAVAEKLATIARDRQVLCVTHLPQVAAMADTHYVVAKDTQDGRTLTSVRELTEAERGQEIARMIGGRSVTPLTLENAREMLKAADQFKDDLRAAAAPSTGAP